MTNNSALCTDPVQFSKKKVYPLTFDIKKKDEFVLHPFDV